MAKQFISIVQISILHDILNEIKTLFSFKIFNFIKTNDFLEETNESFDITNSIIISKKHNHQLLSSKKIVTNNLILLEDKPIKIGQLLDKINVLLIKKKI